MKHRTKDGRWIDLHNLDDRHLLNIIERQKRLSTAGVKIISGVGGIDSDDFDVDVTIEHGDKALKALRHQSYVDEAKQRGLL